MIFQKMKDVVVVIDDNSQRVGKIFFKPEHNEYYFEPHQGMMYNVHILDVIHDFLEGANRDKELEKERNEDKEL